MKIQYQHWTKIRPILKILIHQCCRGYQYMLEHWGKYIIYEDTDGITQILKVKDYREGKVEPLPEDWFDRLYCLDSVYSAEKYQKDLIKKTNIHIEQIPQSFLFGGGYKDVQVRRLKNMRRVVDRIEEDSFTENAKNLLRLPKHKKSGMSVSEAWLFHSYQDSPSRNKEGILWMDDSLAKNEDVKKTEYYIPCISKGMYICLDKKILSLYVGNVMLYNMEYEHWEGDNYDCEEYLYCFADALFLYNHDFNKTKNEFLEICQDNYEEDERYIYAYLLQEQLEILQNRSDSFFHTLKFTKGHFSLGGKPV